MTSTFFHLMEFSVFQGPCATASEAQALCTSASHLPGGALSAACTLWQPKVAGESIRNGGIFVGFLSINNIKSWDFPLAEVGLLEGNNLFL